MPARIRAGLRRTKMQMSADGAAETLAKRVGATVRETRLALGLTQARVAARAGVHPSTIGLIERGRAASVSMRVWYRVALSVDCDLRAYIEGISGADRPRDHVHLRNQESVLAFAATGGWTGVAEAAVDGDLTRSRSADVLLRRARERAMIEVWDWFDDVGGAWRDSVRKHARMAPDGPDDRIGLCWVVRATRRNREIVREHRRLFGGWFPGSNGAWLRALTDPTAPMPDEPGLLWISVDGKRLSAADLRLR